MSLEAMKLALDALEQHGTPLLNHEDAYSASLTVLRQAIEQAEKQEPVAWVQDVEFEQLPEFAFSWVKTRLHDKPLYTHPPQREPAFTNGEAGTEKCPPGGGGYPVTGSRLIVEGDK